MTAERFTFIRPRAESVFRMPAGIIISTSTDFTDAFLLLNVFHDFISAHIFSLQQIALPLYLQGNHEL